MSRTTHQYWRHSQRQRSSSSKLVEDRDEVERSLDHFSRETRPESFDLGNVTSVGATEIRFAKNNPAEMV